MRKSTLNHLLQTAQQHHAKRRYAEAVQTYKKLLALDRANNGARYGLACSLVEKGNTTEAIELLNQLIAVMPDLAEAYYTLGVAEGLRGNLKSAADSYRKAIARNHERFEYHYNLGATLYAMERAPEAAESYREAARIKPTEKEAHYSLGVVLHSLGQAEAAVEAYRRAVTLDPGYVDALTNLGAAAVEMGLFDEAEEALRRAAALAPKDPKIHGNLGKLELVRGEITASIGHLRTALTLQPNHVHSLCHLGSALELLGDLTAAKHCYEIALDNQDASAARFSLSLVNLAEGNFSVGWRYYEARWQALKSLRRTRRSFVQPQWRGEPIQGKRILVYGEQGLGDTLQFARYIPMLAEAGAIVYFEVQRGLCELAASLKGVTKLIVEGDSLPEFDFQCPLMSLPLAFRTEMSTIPGSVPYIQAPETYLNRWSARIDPSRFNVGIVWSGNPNHAHEKYRSLPARALANLGKIEGTTIYSLQKGYRAPEIESCADLGVVNIDPLVHDMAETAAVVSNLDLVITIDTSIAHLAGALGKPVWVLLHAAPDWRWLRNTDRSPWYPTARLFRQTKLGDWQSVLDRVTAELQHLANCRMHGIASMKAHSRLSTGPWSLRLASRGTFSSRMCVFRTSRPWSKSSCKGDS